MGTPREFAEKLIRLPRLAKSAAVMLVDLCAIALALCLAWSLKLDQVVLPGTLPWSLVAVAAISGVAALWSVGFYSAVNRFISRAALLRSGIVAVFSAVVVQAYNVFFLDARTMASVLVVFAVFMLLHVGGSRLVVRALLNSRKQVREPVVIYGAGAEGAQLAAMLHDAGAYQVVAFLDSNRALQGRSVEGLIVHAPEYLEQLIKKFRVGRVLLAIPNHSRRERRAVLDALEQHSVHVQTMPEIADIIAGNASVTDLREVDAGDLLGRPQVAPTVELLHGCIRGKVVMVSGAGGSIGSELCRQIVRLLPVRLVLLEISEAALYQIDRELRSIITAEQLPVEVVALLCSAHHRHRKHEILRTYRIQTIYHAAAYKHVPIVEQNVIEGIYNNVFSTYYLAEAAFECRIETFVLISSDKAVNPTNVMGTTKRFAELILQGMQRRTTRTRFCMVRFGNVLESSGSVVPLFREQIHCGGPVTVTHKDIIRYFMTIPESAQLVIQAGSMAHGGDVFVLDMSEPIRIDELARRMIRLSGLTVRDAENPEGDIEIVYTGLRPAEKLYEELLIGDNVTATEHPRIMRATEHCHSWAKMQQLLDDLLTALTEFNCEQAVALLRDAVAEYRPLSGIQDLVWVQSQEPATSMRSQVTDIRSHRNRNRSESDRPQIAS